MDTKQVTDALERLFQQHRVIFWNDPDREFVDYFKDCGCPLENVNVLRLDEVAELDVKLQIERKQTQCKFLIYSPQEEPDLDDDWLLDIRLYSHSFRADKAAIVLDELGLQTHSLADHLKKRQKFCDSKDRLQKLKAIASPNDQADDLDRKMLAVTVKADQPELYNILRSLLHLYADADDIELRKSVPAWDQIEKFDLAESFWRFVKSTFGYIEESPSLENLVVRLFITDFLQHLRGNAVSLEHLFLPASGRANCVVCLAQWRDSASKGSSYDRLSEYVATRVNLQDKLHNFDIDNLIDVQTFMDVEAEVARNLKDRVLGTADTINLEDIRSVATKRRAGHWVLATSGDSNAPRKQLNSVYEALVVATEFFHLRNLYRDSFEFDDSVAMYRAYEQEIYKFDQLYRHFCEQADNCKNWNMLKPLREQVEAVYSNWYIQSIGLAWGRFVENGLLEKWKLTGIPNQYDFFKNNVESRLDGKKTFVIISDAFRYEVANELTQELNGKYRLTAQLSSQLCVLPSHTALGMASLLPHKQLGYDPKGSILVDGKPCATVDQRTEILSSVDGIVFRADELLKMKKEQGREAIADKKVIYIYHDEIDSRGEKLATEADTFDAVRKAINDLGSLIRFVINSLNGNHVIVTADHGFLFTESKPDETHRSKIDHKPDGTAHDKKRYLLGRNLPTVDEAFHGTTKVSANADGDMEFWLPKAANLFRFSGGVTRYLHGGTMLQEVVVPVITVKQVKGKGLHETKTKEVGVQVLGVNHRVTTPKYRFQLLQTEPVSERVRPVILKIAIYQGSDPVTNIDKVTFDSTSTNMEQRTKQVVLTLEDRQYDKKTKYVLRLRDAETDIEQSTVEIIIDRAFTDDF
jgi:uncharacterized protein (TIGR02687 family)